jgi:hypothetical protein
MEREIGDWAIKKLALYEKHERITGGNFLTLLP